MVYKIFIKEFYNKVAEGKTPNPLMSEGQGS